MGHRILSKTPNRAPFLILFPLDLLSNSTMKLPFLAAASSLILFACQSNNTAVPASDDTTATQKETVTETIPTLPPVDPKWNRFALMLSGDTTLYGENNSNIEVWKNYACNSSQKWDVLNEKVAKPIQNWVSEQQYNTKYPTRTLLYPFAGGDFFYANLFFPDKDTIIMVGLEPPGYLFNPDSVNRELLATYLTDLEKSLFYPHKLGFFRTKSMAIDFEKGLLNGTVHTCLYYLAKANKQIHYVKAMNFDKNGNFSDVSDIGIQKHGKKGYRIGYAAKGDKQVKELIYFAENLANSGVYYIDNKVKSLIPAAKFMEKHHNTATFLKAATYLMHKSYFSWIRNTCTQASPIVLQDDSGIPLKLLEDSEYKVQLLGEYTRVIPLFSNLFQPDLKERYQIEKPAKLPFTIGYNAQFGECNLQLATK